MSIKVFIATSVDGYIAKSDGNIEWLHELPNPDGDDFGYNDFFETIDALVMGRVTYEKVLSFDQWPYTKKVFVLSNSLKEADKTLEGKVEMISGELEDIISNLASKGYKNLYIDGGKTIQSFIKSRLIDEITISRIPIILGEGLPLFAPNENLFKLTHKSTIAYDNGIVKSHYLVEK